MSVLSFNPADIGSTAASITKFMSENVLLCAVLFGSFGLMYLYMFMNNKAVDTEVYEVDLLSSGISTIMISFLLIGLDESGKGFDLSSIDWSTSTAKVAIFLCIYALILIIFAFVKVLPKFLVIILGNAELDFFINFLAILMTDGEIALTGTLIAVIAAPLIGLFILQRIRRMMGR